jgi:hypothetical protein
MTYAIVAYVLSLLVWAAYLLLLGRRIRREVERRRG